MFQRLKRLRLWQQQKRGVESAVVAAETEAVAETILRPFLDLPEGGKLRYARSSSSCATSLTSISVGFWKISKFSVTSWKYFVKSIFFCKFRAQKVAKTAVLELVDSSKSAISHFLNTESYPINQIHSPKSGSNNCRLFKISHFCTFWTLKINKFTKFIAQKVAKSAVLELLDS